MDVSSTGWLRTTDNFLINKISHFSGGVCDNFELSGLLKEEIPTAIQLKKVNNSNFWLVLLCKRILNEGPGPTQV